MSKLTTQAMQIIAEAGDARSQTFEAYAAVCAGNKQQCDDLLVESDKNLKQAHRVHLAMLSAQSAEPPTAAELLLATHAQNHLMTALLAQDLVKTQIQQQLEIQQLRKQLLDLGANTNEL